MSDSFFPELETSIIIETDQMRRVTSKTMAVHRGSALLPWVGRSRLGKTTTARFLNNKINENFTSDDPRAFRSIHYEVGEISSWSNSEQKRGIRSLFHACIGRMDEGFYRRSLPEDLARELVYALKKKRIQMIFIDEAGNLSIDAIRGMVLVRDTAELENWTLTLVFIGMDDLPATMVSLPQIKNRTDEWCYFEPYSLQETFELLGKLHPHFASLDLNKKEHLEQVEFVYEQFGGVPGLLTPFIRRLNSRQHTELEGIIDITGLMAVHLSTLRDKDKALSDSEGGYTGKIKNKSLEELLKI
jgi:hypothetical protein